MNVTIFTTVHGSRLYGFEHANSDYDTYAVTDSRARRVSQSVTGEWDRTIVGLDRFLELASSGNHQAVEALFSPVKVWSSEGEKYRPLIESMRVAGGEVFLKYERTIRRFAHGDFKRRRHAVRLAWNLAELRETGRMMPALNDDAKHAANEYAETYEGAALLDVLQVPHHGNETT